MKPSPYQTAGVDSKKEETALQELLHWVRKSLSLCEGIGRPILDIGFFANVVDIGNGLGLAVSTDGVGTKIIVAQMMGKYDTLGIDCVAMNVNDVLCVGAKPIAMLDYLAVQDPVESLLEAIGKGLYEGAKRAGTPIPGGELTQVREMIRAEREGWGFDLVGTCVGIVPLDRIIVGDEISDSDVVIGVRSTGVHSNGLTLARKVFFQDNSFTVDTHFSELGRTLGEELLEPTAIYAKEILAMLDGGVPVKGLAHMTSDGFLNLLRLKADTGYILDDLPPPQPIFSLIQKIGHVPEEEMFRVFNMGIGFCVVVPPSESDRAIAIAHAHGKEAFKIGRASTERKREVLLEQCRLAGRGDTFHRI